MISKILLPPNKMKPWLRVHITLDMQLAAERLRPTEEHTYFARAMDLADTTEHVVPVRAAEVGGCAEARDGIVVRVGVVDHDVRGVVGIYVGC